MSSDINKRILETISEAQKDVLAIIGSALFWAWAFAWALNKSVLPVDTNDVEIAYLSSTIAYVITALYLFFRFTKEKTTHTKNGVFIFTIMVSVSTFIEILISAMTLDAWYSFVVMTLLGFANGAGLLYLSISWGARYTISGRKASFLIIASFLLAFIINVLFELLPYPVSAILVVSFPVASTLLWFIDATSRQERTKEVWSVVLNSSASSSREILAGDINPTVLPWRTISVLSVVGFLASFFNSFKVPSQSGVNSLTIAFLVAATLCALYLLLLYLGKRLSSIKTAYLLLIPITTFSLLLIVFLGQISELSCGLLLGSAFILHVVIWVQLAQVSVNEGLAPLVSYGIGGILVTVLQILGNLFGRIMQLLNFSSEAFISIFAMSSILVLNTSIVFLLHRDEDRKAQLEIMADDSILKDQEYEDAINIFANRHGLSEREEEVFSLFIRGRNIPYIAEKLYVTSGTVKSHSHHIFQKTQVANRQQLLDLFESERRNEIA